MAQVLFSNILRTTLISSIGICIILLLKKTLFKEYTKSFNYYIWLIVIVRMILPFKIPIYLNSDLVINKLSELNTLDNLNTNTEAIRETSNNVASLRSSSNANQVIENVKHFNINVFEILSYLWLIALLIIITYRIFSYLRLKRTLVDLSADVQDEKINYIYKNLLAELKIKKNILLKVSDYTSVPFGIGVFKSYIILPRLNYEETEVKWILKHELIHYKKKNLLYKFLVMAVSSIYWFNPLIYVMNKYINIECELSCDEKILYKCDFKERQNYALALINLLKQNQGNFINTKLATELGNKEILKRRFDSMLNRKTKRGIFFGALAITIAICSLGVLSTKANSNVINETQEANSNAINETQESADTNSNKNTIETYELEASNYKGYYLVIKDPTRVKIGYTSKLMIEGEKISEIAKNNKAVAAISGGGFADVPQEEVKLKRTGATPTGIIISNGKLVYSDLKDDEKSDSFAIAKDGQLIVGKYSTNDLTNLDAQEALSFGPSLVINGEKTEIQEDQKNGFIPRTAIGQEKDGSIIMLVIDAIDSKHRGASIDEVQEIMYKLGSVNAINLAGASATTMYYDNEVINKPISMLSLGTDVDSYSREPKEMKLPTAVIVK